MNIQNNRKSDVVIPHGQFVRSLAANLQNCLVVFGNKETDLSRLISSIDLQMKKLNIFEMSFHLMMVK